MSLDSEFAPAAALVLAAGAAARMGMLKQLLPYRGGTLLSHSIGQAVEAGFDPIVVVTGAEAEMVRASIAAERIEVVRNEDWRSGMGSSIAAGIRRLRERGAEMVAAILLADQPLVTAEHLRAMRRLHSAAPAGIVAAKYRGIVGVPALFGREFLEALASLPPEAGARHLLRAAGAVVTPFSLPEAAIDIDTPDDFAALESRAKSTSEPDPA